MQLTCVRCVDNIVCIFSLIRFRFLCDLFCVGVKNELITNTLQQHEQYDTGTG